MYKLLLLYYIKIAKRYLCKYKIFKFNVYLYKKIYKINLNEILYQLKEDFNYYLINDPSLKSKKEILYLNSFLCIIIYRYANLLFKSKKNNLARRLMEYAHFKTGIDIHPAASISYPLFIDHGTGIVIGETCIIGKYVKIYHGVTLGAKYITNMKKRHPTIEDNVTLYCNSGVFGNITIRRNTVIKAYKIFVE